MIADETRPRCASIAGGLLLSLRGVNSNPGAAPEDMVSIRLSCTAERVVSTRRLRLLTIRDLVGALERGEGPRTTGELTAMLADRLPQLPTLDVGDTVALGLPAEESVANMNVPIGINRF